MTIITAGNGRWAALAIVLSWGCGGGSPGADAAPAAADGAVTLTGVTIEPTSATIPCGATVELAAQGTYSDGTSRTLGAEVTWQSSDPEVAAVDDHGTVTGIADGFTDITATAGAITSAPARVEVACDEPILVVTPVDPTVPSGLTQQFTATLMVPDGDPEDVTDAVTWTSSDEAVATIDATGLADAIGPGTAIITASFDGVEAATNLIVGPPVAP